jgi:hypothetical protein
MGNATIDAMNVICDIYISNLPIYIYIAGGRTHEHSFYDYLEQPR